MALQSLEEFAGNNSPVMVSSLYPMGGNYGGILQAYALQRVISELGYDVATIDSSQRFERSRLVARRIRRFVFDRINDRSTPYPLSRSQRRRLQARPLEFIESNIRTIDFFAASKADQDILLNRLRAIVVGSDQVWRGGMADLADQFLDYAADSSVPRISYAASFGSDRLIRFSSRSLKRAKELLPLFSAVSVRERSGIEICRRVWGIDAVQHVDPTMLLTKADYAEFVSRGRPNCDRGDGELFVYLLDRSAATESVVSSLVESLGFTTTIFPMEQPRSKVEASFYVGRFDMLAVEDWLSGFANSDFVVTDSFHGTVFAIIFNKPFLTIGNVHRGLARFYSLLDIFGLSSRLVDLESERAFDASSEIDWDSVNAILQRERERGIQFLENLL